MRMGMTTMAMGSAQGGGGLDVSLYTWVATDGTDTTGDGTFDLPYATLAKAESLTLTGTKATIYVKAGTYNTSSTTTVTKAYTWIAYGAVVLTSDGTGIIFTFGASTSATIMDGFTFNGLGAKSTVMSFYQTSNKTLKNCTFTNVLNAAPHVAIYGGTRSDSNIIDGCTLGYVKIYPTVNGSAIIRNCTFNMALVAVEVLDASATLDLTVENNSFTYNQNGSLFSIGRSIDLTMTGNTITYAKTPTGSAGLFRVLNTGAWVGTLTITDNVVNYGAFSNNAGATFAIKGDNPAFDVVFSDNAISCAAGGALAYQVLYYDSQASLLCERNTIDVSGSTTISTVIQVAQSSKANTGNLIIRNNTIKHRNGYAILIGQEATSGHDDYIVAPVIHGNLIYGERYYVPTAVTTGHDIFVGFAVNADIRHNVIIGGSFAIVCKGTNVAAYTAGGIFNNLFIDCVRAVQFRGLNDVKVYGNTILTALAQAGSCFYLTAHSDHLGNIAGFDFQNNIIYCKNAGVQAVYEIGITPTSQTVTIATCANNVIQSDTSVFAKVYDTDTNKAAWQALGFDADEDFFITPELTNTTGISAAQTISHNLTPIAGSNVIGIGANLGTGYDDAIKADAVPPILATDLENQPAAPDLWTVGAFVR